MPKLLSGLRRSRFNVNDKKFLKRIFVPSDRPLCDPVFWAWFAFGFPAFAAVLGILWLMITRSAFHLFL